MNRPKSMQIYKDIDLKLGIKSSLPKAKPTLALLILLWLSNDKSADLRYSVQDATKIRMSEECKNNLRVFILYWRRRRVTAYFNHNWNL